MDALVHEGWLFFKLVIDNWAALLIISGIFDEYTALGGNHYAHEIYERYKVGKENDF